MASLEALALRRGLIGLCSAVALAQPACAELGFNVTAAGTHYKATEHLDDGTVANVESGELNGHRGAIWWNDKAQAWRLGVELGHLAGSVGYRGRSQFGFPIRTTTHLDIDEALAKGRWSLIEQAEFTSGLTATLGWRRIDRRIAASLRSTPLNEMLYWRFIQIGGQARWTVGADWFVNASAAVEQGLSARLAVDFRGVADPVQLQPARKRGQSVGIEFGRNIGRDATISARASQAWQQYGASAWKNYTRGGQVIGQVRYPGSKQRLAELQLVLEVNWR